MTFNIDFFFQRFALQSLQYLLADYPPFHQDIGDMGEHIHTSSHVNVLTLPSINSNTTYGTKFLKDIWSQIAHLMLQKYFEM